MNPVIKFYDAVEGHGIRPITMSSRENEDGSSIDVPSELDQLRFVVAQLEDSLRAQTRALEDATQEISAAYLRGQEAGRIQGLDEAQDNQHERTELLRKSLDQACAHVAKNISSIQRLAPLIARDGLEMIFGNGGPRADLVQEIIRSQCDKIEHSTLISVKVSEADFPSSEATDGIVPNLQRSGVMVTASAEIPAGACVMELRLGELHVGIDQQWNALRNTLEHMATP